ncbi:hypothetical protein MB901379_00610 [Mycobacterium basiliense]|uniref:Uncharacterized protein n=1 Tax=Mycobacterium basiliense TaxID=2094119 RepID=A0A3S4FNA9_9MYCO|nr:hypothetical protein MB901379_00610 [Mycobacterium basiliense]
MRRETLPGSGFLARLTGAPRFIGASGVATSWNDLERSGIDCNDQEAKLFRAHGGARPALLRPSRTVSLAAV